MKYIEKINLKYNKTIFHYVIWYFIIFFTVYQFFLSWNIDQKAMLSFSTELIKHKIDFYKKIFDPNLPLIFIIHSVTAFLINNLNIQDRLAFHLYNLFLCFVGYFTLKYSLRRSKLDLKDQFFLLDAYAFIIVVTPSITLDWGQREHLLFVFSLPWVIQMLYHQPPTYISTLLASIGFCLRPYNVIIPLFVIGAEAIKTKGIFITLHRSKGFIILGILTIYALTILIIFNTYIKSVIYTSIMTYTYICPPSPEKYKFFILFSLIMMPMIYLARYMRNIFVSAAFFFSCLLIYLTNQPWMYTYSLIITPFLTISFMLIKEYTIQIEEKNQKITSLIISMLFLICFLSINNSYIYLCIFIIFMLTSSILDSKFVKKIYFEKYLTFNRILKSSISILFLSFFTHLAFKEVSREAILSKNDDYVIMQSNTQDQDIKEEIMKSTGDDFVFLSTSFWGSTYVRLGKTRHHYAFDWLWPLPWVYAHQDNSHALKIRSLMADYLVQALQHQPAPTLLIDRSPKMRLIPLIPIEEFLSQGNATLKKILENYKSTKIIDHCQPNIQSLCKVEVLKPKEPLLHTPNS